MIYAGETVDHVTSRPFLSTPRLTIFRAASGNGLCFVGSDVNVAA
jgi:hypothetical protein